LKWILYLPRPGQRGRSWKNAGDRRTRGWCAFPVLDVAGFGPPDPLSDFALPSFFGVQAAGGWSGRYRLRRKKTLEAPPVRVAAGFRSDLPGIAKKRAARVTSAESSPRWLAGSDFGTRDEKKCLPPLPWCGRMTVAWLGGGRPAANGWQTSPAHEQSDGPKRR
jgi:hypothetical protein